MSFKEIGEALGFENINDVYVRKENDFCFYLKNWEYLIYDFPAIYVCLNKSIDKSLIKAIEQAALDNACSTYSINENDDTLIISLPEGNHNSKEYKEQFDTLIKRLVKYFNLEGFKPMDVCPVCKEKAEYGKFGDNYSPIHEECIITHIAKLKSSLEEQKATSKSPILSILTSIGFALIGLIPALCLCLFTYDYISPLLVLISIGSIGGYYLVNAYPTKELKLITSLIPTIIILAFTAFSVIYMAHMKELEFVDYLLSNNWVGIRKIAFGILFSLGGFGIMKIVNSFKKDYSKELEKFDC